MQVLESLTPGALRKLPIEDVVSLAAEIRKFLITSISRTGGHIGANLGTIELTLAAHYVFESPHDRLVWDTGHQGYTHKIATGRARLFPSLNAFGGMSRFLTREESEHDTIDATHAGTSLATAAGLAFAMREDGSDRYVVAMIGDGSLVEGMSFEGLNFVADMRLRLVIILNDNQMAIAPNVGGVRHMTSGRDWADQSRKFFEALGFDYIPVADGHDVPQLVDALRAAKDRESPVVVHVRTEKGRGLKGAREHPYHMHFSMPFNPETGEGASPTIAGRTYAVVAAEALLDCLRSDSDIIAITPATPYASALDKCFEEAPRQVVDVGMAEQHAVSMACGLALGGKKPVVCFQSTFMQRAFDQLIHDVCYMNLPVTLLVVRSGFSGYDGPTHHGLYDIPSLRLMPNMQVLYPIDSADLEERIVERLRAPVGPMAILYPYEAVPDPEPEVGERRRGLSVVSDGHDGMILCLGNRLEAAHRLRLILAGDHGVDVGIACIGELKPFPVPAVLELCTPCSRVITLEEGTLPGGFGSIVSEALSDHGIAMELLRTGVADHFVPAGGKDECSQVAGIAPEQIAEKVLDRWPELVTRQRAVQSK